MVAASIVGIVLLQGGPAAQRESPDIAELTKLEQSWNEAHLRGDVEPLERLWAEDLVVAVPRMRIFTRTDSVQMVRSGRMPFKRYETSDLRVRVHGDAAVVTGRLRRSRTLGERVIDDDWHFTKVSFDVRGNGKWLRFMPLRHLHDP